MVLFRYKNDKNNTTLRKHQQPPTISPSISPPAVVQQKEGILSNVMGNIVQGMALGTGSQLASRTIDSIMGPRKIEINAERCVDENKYYLQCLSKNEDDISKCREFFNLLDKCKNNNNN
jgi:hypothetical protein